MDRLASPSEIQLGPTGNISQITGLGDTCISQNVTINGQMREVVIIMKTSDYQALSAQGASALNNRILGTIANKISSLPPPQDVGMPQDVRIIESNVKEVDEEFLRIENAIAEIQKDREKHKSNFITVVSKMREDPKNFKQVDIDGYNRQHKAQMDEIQEKIFKLQDERKKIVSHRVGLIREIHTLQSKNKKNNTETPTIGMSRKQKSGKDKTEEVIDDFFLQVKKHNLPISNLLSNYKTTLFLAMTEDFRRQDLTKLYDHVMHVTNGNQSHPLYVSYVGVCEVLKIDMTSLMSEDRKISIPKFMFVKQSDVFDKMVTSPMLETKKGEINFKGFESPAVNTAFVRCIENRNAAAVNGDNVIEILKGAEAYKLDWLVKECKDYITQNLSPEIVLFIVQEIALKYEYSDLMSNCIAYTYMNQDTISKEDLDKLKAIIFSLGVSEWQILEKFKNVDVHYSKYKSMSRVEIPVDKMPMFIESFQAIGKRNMIGEKPSWYQPSLELRVLPVPLTTFSPETFQALFANNYTVTSLNMRDIRLEKPTILTSLKNHPVLTRLCVDWSTKSATVMSQALAELLKSNSKLQYVQIPSSSINIENITHAVKTSKSLQHLSINNDILLDKRSSSFQSFGDMVDEKTPLRSLNVASIPDIDDLKVLESNKNITALRIRTDLTNHQTLIHLENALKKNNVLTCLNVSYSRINTFNFAALMRALGENLSLRALSIRGLKNPKEVDLNAVSIALSKNQSLQVLDLGHLELNDKSLPVLANILGTHSRLTAIYLNDNEFTENGWNTLFNALKLNASLKFLDASTTQLSSFKGLYEMIEENDTLETLVLNSTNLDLLQLAKALKKNLTIKTVLLKNLTSIKQEQLRILCKEEPDLADIFVVEPDKNNPTRSSNYLTAKDKIKNQTHNLHYIGEI